MYNSILNSDEHINKTNLYNDVVFYVCIGCIDCIQVKYSHNIGGYILCFYIHLLWGYEDFIKKVIGKQKCKVIDHFSPAIMAKIVKL